MVILYKIHRPTENDPTSELQFFTMDTQIVSKKKFNQLVKEGWTLIRKEYFILTPLQDFWLKCDNSNKVKILGISLASLISIIALFFK
jgi:hypothetical protein